MGYDEWLEAPYQAMIAESDRFYDWCESEDIDPEDPTAEEQYLAYCEDEAEAAAEAEAEAYAEREMDDDWGW